MPPVFIDASELENALLNLVVNARDAMPQGGSLTIAAKVCDLGAGYPPVKTGEIEPGPYACISVTDTGVGMTAAVLERAFEPFFTTKPRGKGSGLGLAMVYGFAKQSGGAVRLYSEAGFGTTVSIYLPLGGAPAELARASAKEEISLKRGGKALIVDDELALLEIASTFLEEMGFAALRAEDAARALHLAQQHGDLDLLITDVVMPGGMDGVELARRVRELVPAVRVIYTSGFPQGALDQRASGKIDAPMLQKPYHRSEFAAIVRRTMESGVAVGDQ